MVSTIIIRSLKWTIIFMILLYIPLIQIVPYFFAFPLQYFDGFGSSSRHIEVTFIYFFIKSKFAISAYTIYYFVVFGIIQLIKCRRSHSKK